MKKRQFLASVIMGGLLAATAPVMAEALKPMTLKVASNYPATSLFSRVQQHYMDLVTKKTDGKVTFEWFYGSVLLKAPDVFPGISRGVVDIGYTVPSAFNPREYPLSDITLPFITENPGAASMAFRDWYAENPAVQNEFKRNNVHMLLTLPAAENVLWSMKKVTKAEDLKGMRIRTLMGPGDALTAMGATAVTVPYTDAIDLLSRGGVDAISTTPFEQGVIDGLPNMVNYLSPAARMGIFAAVITGINLETWQSFPKSLQSIFTDSANEALMFYVKEQSKEADRSVDILLKSTKVEVVPMDPAEEKRWREMSQEAINKKYIEKARRVGADGQALIDSYVALVRKYEKEYPYVTGIDRYMAKKGN
jgi:TRAP-type C4-dicarboxylate transport system substrate-binding protein